MNYQVFADCIEMPCCVIAVNKTTREIRIHCANRLYKDIMGPAYYDNMLYYELVPKDNKFEEFCFRAACMKQRMHAYVETRALNCWTDQTLIPLASDDENTGYCQFVFEFTKEPEADRMASVSAGTAVSVVTSCIKLVGAEDFRESVVSVLEDIVEKSGATASDILLLDHEKKQVFVFSETRKKESWENKKSTEDLIPYSMALTWEEMIGDSNEIIIMNDAEMEEMARRNPAWVASMKEGGVQNLVLIPLRQKREVNGYLYVVNFNVEKVVEVKELLELTAFFLGAEIANYQLLQQLDTMSHIDVLTGLNNHNAMLQTWKQYENGRKKGAFGVVSIDLNGLKQVNDNDGHDAGDRLLVRAAEILQEYFDSRDLYRSGGDEFLVITDRMPRGLFERNVEKLKADVEKNAEVSFAIGSFWSDGTVDILTAFRDADQTMYADKRKYYQSHTRFR